MSQTTTSFTGKLKVSQLKNNNSTLLTKCALKDEFNSFYWKNTTILFLFLFCQYILEKSSIEV